jgi:hypothetical protein
MASIHIGAAVNPQAARRYQRLSISDRRMRRTGNGGVTRRGWHVTLALLGAGGARDVENETWKTRRGKRGGKFADGEADTRPAPPPTAL